MLRKKVILFKGYNSKKESLLVKIKKVLTELLKRTDEDTYERTDGQTE